MSVNFEDPMNPEAKQFMREVFGKSVAQDDKTALFDKVGTLHQTQMKKLANIAEQPVSVEINSIGDIKEVGGVKYQLDEAGWKRLPIGS